MSLDLTIIQPSHYHTRTDRRVFKTRRRALVPLTLPYLAALTPPEWRVTLIDEQLEDIDYARHTDLVAITTWTVHSPRAYDIADEYRRRGVKVIMGGPHVFFYPEEAAEHSDAIGVGEAEPIWAQMLADAAAGRLQKEYRAAPLTQAQLSGLPKPSYDALDLSRYGPFRTFTLQSSRGCPLQCEFCSERLYLSTRYRWRPPEDVVEDVRHSGGRNIFFGESNFGGKRHRAMELMEALIPLKVRWSTLWTSNFCEDGEFLDLAVRSGLLHVNIGIESIHGDTIRNMNKRVNKVDHYANMFANMRKRGISFSLNFIFGWDNEDMSVFPATFEFLERHKVPAAYFNVLTPTPGTVLFNRLKAEGRILHEDEIDRWPGQLCHVQPAWCTPAELEENVQWIYRRFYSMRSMLRRLPLPTTKANIANWVVNMSERRMAQTTHGNNDFDMF
ncbi:MAG: B12-binding domain-containing radical SAM protein [Rhodomicrobium sp.]